MGGTAPAAHWIRGAVDTVERFQGHQRDVIIASFALGDPDQIEDEEEFLMRLNRFNVMASRARAKLVVLVSRQVVDHLAKEVEVLRESRLLKVFAESFCNQGRPTAVGYISITVLFSRCAGRSDGGKCPVQLIPRFLELQRSELPVAGRESEPTTARLTVVSPRLVWLAGRATLAPAVNPTVESSIPPDR